MLQGLRSFQGLGLHGLKVYWPGSCFGGGPEDNYGGIVRLKILHAKIIHPDPQH